MLKICGVLKIGVLTEMLCGLCGNADGNKANDMATKDGQLVASRAYAAVGNSWIVPGKGYEDPE